MEAGKQGRETLVHFRLVGRADRGHRAPMKGVGKGDQLGPIRIAILVLVISARGFDRSLDRFCAGIGEEDRIGKCVIDETLCQHFALRRAIHVRHMHQRCRLLLNCADQSFVAVAQKIDGNAAGEIEIARAILVNQMAMLALNRAHAATRVNRHERSDRHGCGFLCNWALGLENTKNGGPVDKSRHLFCVLLGPLFERVKRP